MSRRSSSKIPTASSDKPQSGERIKSDLPESKFELIAELGRGGMATVYLARARKRPERLLVLKQLRSELAENPEFLAMFLEEARLAGKLQHPNIVETYEVGQDAGTYYIAMEYLEGLSLQAVLTKFGWKGEFSFPLQVFVLIEALKALEQAYSQRDDDGTPLKIVHRDVSPPNIIITFDGQVKLVDFGIAKAANSHVETRTGLIKGKLTYMAPEQAQSGDVDSRTDIYSVGVMLWQAAAGTRRWKGIENTEVLKRLHSGDVAEPPNARKNDLPAIVDDIVVKAIDPDPEKRHRSASAFRGTLESLLREMRAEIKSADLADFMTKHFGDARKRAATVMNDRLRELDKREKDSVTSIRASNDRKARPPANAAQKSPAPGRVQVGGAATVLAEKLSRPKTPAKTVRSSGAYTDTEVSPTSRRSHALPIGVIGFAAAAVLAYLGLRTLKTESHPIAVPMSPPIASAASAGDAPGQTLPSSVQATTPATSTGGAPAHVPTEGALAPQIAAPQNAGPHHRHGHAQNAPAAPVPDPQPVPVAMPAVAATTTPPPAPTTTSTSTSTDHPSLDKKDPWQDSHGAGVDRSDPWGRSSATPAPHPDPWAK